MPHCGVTRTKRSLPRFVRMFELVACVNHVRPSPHVMKARRVEPEREHWDREIARATKYSTKW